MKIVNKKIADIVPYEHNPRHNDEAVNFVANSIREFGFKVPIVLDANNVIIAGHTRVEAAKQLGLKDVPTIMADDLTPDQVKAYRLADNKTGELASWDWDKLEQELAEIANMDMTRFGFDEADIDIESMQEVLDELYEEAAAKKNKPHMVTCPSCGHEFDVNEK